eukprot:Hpha_TRINITY_DN10835_c0_g1::TRINITY_DN10835_c0_g1_i1::g.23434::m.23434
MSLPVDTLIDAMDEAPMPRIEVPQPEPDKKPGVPALELYSAAVFTDSTHSNGVGGGRRGSDSLPADVPSVRGCSVDNSVSARESSENSGYGEGGSSTHSKFSSPLAFAPTPEVWPRLLVTCSEKPALAGTYDVLYAGNRRHNGRPVWACHAKRLYSCSEEGEPPRWAIAVGTDAPLSNRRQVQARHSHGDDPMGVPSLSDTWEWFDSEEGQWVPAPETSVESIGSPRRTARRSDSPTAFPPSPTREEMGPLPLSHPGTGRIISPATVRQEESLESAPVGSGPLMPDVEVEVEEIRGRRARISSPLVGWLSLHTKGGTLVAPAYEKTHCKEFQCDIIDCCPPAILNLNQDSPVFMAGLRDGDRIVWLQERGRRVRPLRGAEDMLDEVQAVIDAIRVGYSREGHPCSVVVNLEPEPEPEPEPKPTPTKSTHPAPPQAVRESPSVVSPSPSSVVSPAPSSGISPSPVRRLSDGAHGVWAVLATDILVDESTASRAVRQRVLKEVHDSEARYSTVYTPVAGARLDACCRDDVLYHALVGSPPSSKEMGLTFQRAVKGAFESMMMAGKGTDQYVEKKSFRLLLVALRRHLELYHLFGCSCVSVDAANVQRSTAVLARWGSAILKGGDIIVQAAGNATADSCPFPQFCAWVAATNLGDVAREEPFGAKQAAKATAKTPAQQGRPVASTVPTPPSGKGTKRARLADTPRQKRATRNPREGYTEMTPPRPDTAPSSRAGRASPRSGRVGALSPADPHRGKPTSPRAGRAGTHSPSVVQRAKPESPRAGRASTISPAGPHRASAALTSTRGPGKKRSASQSAPQPRRVADEGGPTTTPSAGRRISPTRGAAPKSSDAPPTVTKRNTRVHHRPDAARSKLSRPPVTR